MTETSPSQPQRRPSLLSANSYLLLSSILLISISQFNLGRLERYTLGIATEITLALLALLFLRLEKLNVPEVTRLRRPPKGSVLLALAMVPGLWITGILLNLIATLILGYTEPMPPSQFPTNALEALVLGFTTIVVAPLCEEFIFRGYVQRAYERPLAWVGILVGGLLFALIHLRFQGLFALIPVALTLGLVAWRTNSLLPGIAIHAAYNMTATVLTAAESFLSPKAVAGVTATLTFIGALMAPISYIALYLLWQRTSPEPDKAPPITSHPRLRWVWVLPLIGLLGIYSYAALTELLIGRFPELVLNAPIELQPPSTWSPHRRLTYNVENWLGQDLGKIVCQQSTNNSTIELKCQADYQGFDLTSEFPLLEQAIDELRRVHAPFDMDQLTPMLHTAPETWDASAAWTRSHLRVQTLHITHHSQTNGTFTLIYPDNQKPVLSLIHDGQREVVPLSEALHPLLLPYEWEWRLSALPFELGYGGDATLVWVDAKGKVRTQDAFVMVRGSEPTSTPNGHYVTWKVTVTWQDPDNNERTITAWYDTAAPHTLVRVNDGAVVYVLTAIGASEVEEEQ